MNEIFYTLHTFMLHSESITYFLMLVSLLGILGFWLFLTARDDDHE
ncbi:MAG: sulfate respiration complex protein HmcD [Pseudomonadota bacterium]